MSVIRFEQQLLGKEIVSLTEENKECILKRHTFYDFFKIISVTVRVVSLYLIVVRLHKLRLYTFKHRTAIIYFRCNSWRWKRTTSTFLHENEIKINQYNSVCKSDIFVYVNRICCSWVLYNNQVVIIFSFAFLYKWYFVVISWPFMAYYTVWILLRLLEADGDT